MSLISLRRSWRGLPLLARELTEMSARRSTYWQRSAFAALLNLIGFVVLADVLFDPNPMRILGRGRDALEAIVYSEFTGIYLLFPFMAAGVLTDEKERNSLEILLITRLSPWEIIVEKLLSRLVPMLTIVALSMPLFAISYSLGGVSLDVLVAAVWTLFLACLQVASLGLICSTLCRTTVAAYLTTVVVGAILILTPIVLSEWRFIPMRTAAMLFPPLVFDFASRRFQSIVPGSIPVLLVSGLSIAGAARLLVPFSATTSRGLGGLFLQGLHGVVLWLGRVARSRMDEMLPRASLRYRRLACADELGSEAGRRGDSSNHQADSSIASLTATTEQPSPHPFAGVSDAPIAWRETQRTLLMRRPYRTCAVIAMTAFVLLMAALASGPGRSLRNDDFSGMHLALQGVVLLVVVTRSATVLSSERSRQTLDVLLTTPLSNREILRQKMAGVRGFAMLFLFPYLVLLVIDCLMKTRYFADHARNPGRRVPDGSFSPVMYLLGSGITVTLYLAMFARLAAVIGLLIRKQIAAIATSVVVIVAWALGLLFVVVLAFELVGVRAGDATAISLLVSPLAFPVVHEFYDHRVFGWSVEACLLVNTALHGMICAVLYRWSGAKLERLLDRGDAAVVPARGL